MIFQPTKPDCGAIFSMSTSASSIMLGKQKDVDLGGWSRGVYLCTMKSDFVSLHPYFRAHPEKLDAVKTGLPRFVEKTETEKENLFYECSTNGDEFFYFGTYETADGLLPHLENVDALLTEMLKMADLTRVEVAHGRAQARRRLVRCEK